MKNGSIDEQMSLQRKVFTSEKENKQTALYTNKDISKEEYLNQSIKQKENYNTKLKR